MRQMSYPALVAADASQSTRVSVAFPATQLFSASVQAILLGAGTNVGTVQLQGSNDAVPAQLSPTNWSNIGSAVTFAANGTKMVEKTDLCYAWIRVLFTNTGGSGVNTISARLNTLGV